MVEVNVDIGTSREEVFAVLADGWAYANWVVGASHIREVDWNWPEAGSRIHHSIGPWPLQIHDVTVSQGADPPARLELRARMWPVGEAQVRIELEELSPTLTRARLSEEIVAGPARRLPSALERLLLAPRNIESLRRLGDLAVRQESKPQR